MWPMSILGRAGGNVVQVNLISCRSLTSSVLNLDKLRCPGFFCAKKKKHRRKKKKTTGGVTLNPFKVALVRLGTITVAPSATYVRHAAGMVHVVMRQDEYLIVCPGTSAFAASKDSQPMQNSP